MVSDDLLREVLTRTKTIALVGLSANPQRPSHQVATFLAGVGYQIIGVNPGLAGQEMFGHTVCADLDHVPGEVDMVDIFRDSSAVPGIVDAALKRWPDLPTIWMQIGVHHEEATAKAVAAGVDVIQNRCVKIEYLRLRMGPYGQ